MTTRTLKRKADDIQRIARSHGVSRVRVFGSHATGHARWTSDIDLLITLKSDRDLLDLIDFKLDLQDLLGCEVDVVTERAQSILAANDSANGETIVKNTF
jgi:predicted nucleotidyltransferase